MKKIITSIIAASLLMFSCTKETSQQPKILGGNIVSTIQINPSTTETRYRNSDVVVYETDLGAGGSLIEIKKGGKKEFAKARIEESEGYRRLFMSTLEGKGIYHFTVNKENIIVDFKVTGDMPLLSMTFQQCMLGLISDCSHSWSCKIICGPALVACSLGWSIGCGVSQAIN